MKTLMTLFCALFFSSALIAQSNLLGSGINAPIGTGNGVGSQPFSNSTSNPPPTPSLNGSTIPNSDEIERMEDTGNFNNGAFGGAMGGTTPAAGSGGLDNGLGNGVGTGAGNETGPGIGDPGRRIDDPLLP